MRIRLGNLLASAGLFLVGFALLWFSFAISTMAAAAPGISGWDWWRTVLEGMFSGGQSATVAGLGSIILGFAFAGRISR